MPANSITLVSHCYCPVGCDVYTEHFKWQAASLVNCRPQCNVTWIVCTDEQSFIRIGRIWQALSSALHDITNVTVEALLLPTPSLLRRSIGRNQAALECTTDVIWFADLDYYFGEGCLDSVCRGVSPDDGLKFPYDVWQNHDHETGEQMIRDNADQLFPSIDKSLFTVRRRKFAIGGLQIVGGRTARTKGYLPGTKWMDPADIENGWRQTNEDMAYRKEFAGSEGIDVDNLFWIRHSVKGADLNGRGEYVGKEVW